MPAAGLTVRCLSPSIQPAEDGVGLVVHGDAVAEVEVISDEPLEAIAMEFGPDAPARLELEGGAVGNRLFRPDGGVVFEVLVVGGTRLPGGGRSYRLSFFLPDAPEQPIGVIFRPQATGSTFAPS